METSLRVRRIIDLYEQLIRVDDKVRSPSLMLHGFERDEFGKEEEFEFEIDDYPRSCSPKKYPNLTFFIRDISA